MPPIHFAFMNSSLSFLALSDGSFIEFFRVVEPDVKVQVYGGISQEIVPLSTV